MIKHKVKWIGADQSVTPNAGLSESFDNSTENQRISTFLYGSIFLFLISILLGSALCFYIKNNNDKNINVLDKSDGCGLLKDAAGLGEEHSLSSKRRTLVVSMPVGQSVYQNMKIDEKCFVCGFFGKSCDKLTRLHLTQKLHDQPFHHFYHPSNINKV